MYAQLLPVPAASPSIHSRDAERRSADFLPSIWGDHFLNARIDEQSKMNHDSSEQQIRNLKAEVKRMLAADSLQLLEKLNLMDQIQRLGIAYHFEKEIGESLEQIHRLYIECDVPGIYHDHDLHSTALLFRLLRQQGYRISCDVFRKFKDETTGSFKYSLIADKRGLLSLYEASHLRVHGEDILKEALAFTLTHLKGSMEEYNDNDRQNTDKDNESVSVRMESPLLAAQVGHALKQCLRKGLTRLEARHYMAFYEEEDSNNKVLLTLAKFDFNLLQKQHQKELNDISRWWKELDFGRKLPFARDRVVECYFWILGVYFEPQYLLARNILTKIIMLTSVMDDIYDAYGTYEELQILTDAIESWDRRVTGQLPQYMQVFYEALLDVFDETEEKLATEEGESYRLFYAKEAMKMQARSYFDEAKWLNEHRLPTYEEYMSVALVSSGYFMLVPISFLGMGQVATEHAFEWSLRNPNKIVRASSLIARLMDDIVSHKFEQERGHVASAVECFMEQHGVTEQQAKEELWKEIDYAWKDINEECLRPLPVPEPLLARILNLARVMDVLYKDKDRYTHPDLELKQLVASLLVDPVPT